MHPDFSPNASSRSVFRRVVVARGSTEPEGYGGNHVVVSDLLDRAMVPGWTKAATVEDRAGSRTKVSELVSAVNESKADLLHISSQEDAHLVPKDSPVPVVVSLHDLFDLRPRAIDAGEISVPLGNRYPSSSRASHLALCKEGMSRANLLLCASEMTLKDAEKMFPRTQCVLIRDSVDDSFWDPIRNPRSRALLGEFQEEEKCLLVSVGEKDPRWRSQFLSEVISQVPEDVRGEISLMRIGVGTIDWDRVAAAFQHAEAMLYPGVSVGFRSPPMEAMASGCPVLASELPLHGEVLPPGCLLSATDPDQWVSAIQNIHSEWRRSGGVPRHLDEEVLSISRSIFGRSAHGEALSRSYNHAIEMSLGK